MTIQAAPEPSDLMWKNCEELYNPWRVLFIEFAVVLLIGVGFGLVVGLEYFSIWLTKQ